MSKKETIKEAVTIPAPNMQEAVFKIRGTAPLVINRFSLKAQREIEQTMTAGKTARSKKKREPKNFEEEYKGAKYVSKEGWEGFNAASIRQAMIRACSLVGFKMTLAKLSIFVVEDGWDRNEPQIPLVRIHGESVMQKDIARVETGQPYITARAAYHDWWANLTLRWDADQFTLQDVSNLLMRAGMQVGIGEGRPNSKKSAGMGWGTFTVETEEKNAKKDKPVKRTKANSKAA
jgi:hypothetical protein